jgi:GNAT superfamily N-acetyltransferase
MTICKVKKPNIPQGYLIKRTTNIHRSSLINDVARLQQKDCREWGQNRSLKKLITSIRKDSCGKYYYSIAYKNSHAIGYGYCTIVRLFSGKKQMRTQGLLVSKNERGKGIGRILLLDWLAWALKNRVNNTTISTHSKNPARYLFENMGFKNTERVPNLYLNLT